MRCDRSALPAGDLLGAAADRLGAARALRRRSSPGSRSCPSAPAAACPVSSLVLTSTVLVRSPAATFCATPTASFSGRVMLRVIHQRNTRLPSSTDRIRHQRQHQVGPLPSWQRVRSDASLRHRSRSILISSSNAVSIALSRAGICLVQVGNRRVLGFLPSACSLAHRRCSRVACCRGRDALHKLLALRRSTVLSSFAMFSRDRLARFGDFRLLLVGEVAASERAVLASHERRFADVADRRD